MKSATLTFSDGSVLALHEGERLSGVSFSKNATQPRTEEQERESILYPELASEGSVLELWSHPDVGLAESVFEVLHNYEWFRPYEESGHYYHSNAVASATFD
ncbi:hypothetical protein [Lacticaseibacillus mingshuiensis]|uniref:hypothetical protein n=1 Tax=Lacticaseibacillus mingshuiensis TaxID=2799574 RepID=UPI00195083FA|nr:hypothetical protein [Lacticaseibacillus mingshuiensis]